MESVQIRKILRAEFGPRKYRITRRGEIHVYGMMPNSDQTGWYLFGYVGSAETEALLKNLSE